MQGKWNKEGNYQDVGKGVKLSVKEFLEDQGKTCEQEEVRIQERAPKLDH